MLRVPLCFIFKAAGREFLKRVLYKFFVLRVCFGARAILCTWRLLRDADVVLAGTVVVVAVLILLMSSSSTCVMYRSMMLRVSAHRDQTYLHIRLPRTRNITLHNSWYPRVSWGRFIELNWFPAQTAALFRAEIRFGPVYRPKNTRKYQETCEVGFRVQEI